MRSHTVSAEGGAAGVIKPGDSLDQHAYDTISGGDWLCDQDAVEAFVREAPEELLRLEHWGCPWSREPDGRIAVRPFGGMKAQRTWCAADKTGLMSRYLIVTHQTAFSPELQRRVTALVAEDPAAEFAVLVPELPSLTFTWEGETVDVARQRAESPKTTLEETAGARIFRTAVGGPDPLQAITDELLVQPGYDTLVICTLPPGVSRWLKLDLVHRTERKFGLRVIHVVADAPTQARP